MTEHTDAANERHEQALPESVPAPDLRPPPATGEPDHRNNQPPEATKPPQRAPSWAESDAAWQPVMDTANGHHTASPTTVTETRPVALLRYRPGITAEATRTVHLVPLPPDGQAGAAGFTLCGALLRPDLVETVTPGQGVPCTLCMTHHRTTSPPPTPATVPPGEGISSETDPLVATVCYQAWGWPVTLRGHQVWLTLQPDTVALVIPVLLAAQLTGILHRDRPPLTLIYPEAPEHWVMLAGGRPEVALPWPRSVYQSTGTLPLPPTVTARGPITWVHPPHADALHQYREFEVFAALRTALRDPPT